MARRARQRRMLAIELELRVAVVAEQHRPVGGVAGLAARTELALVHIVGLVAAAGAAGRRGAREPPRRMARLARLDLRVLALERPLGIRLVIEAHRGPLPGLV